MNSSESKEETDTDMVINLQTNYSRVIGLVLALTRLNNGIETHVWDKDDMGEIEHTHTYIQAERQTWVKLKWKTISFHSADYTIYDAMSMMGCILFHNLHL